MRKAHWLPPSFAAGLAAAALAAGWVAAPAAAATSRAAPSREARSVLPFVADDYARALADARARDVPLFVESWAPW